MTPVLYDAPVTGLGGAPADLHDYEGRALLVVNTASQCGLTPQYAGLQRLQERFADRGFTVIAFPCNQFGRQEPGTADDIRSSGGVPYLIPTGGSVPVGAVGYARAAAELLEQCRAIGEFPARLYLATGSFGTQAGLMVGSRATGAPWQVRGVAVSLPADDFPDRTRRAEIRFPDELLRGPDFARDELGRVVVIALR